MTKTLTELAAALPPDNEVEAWAAGLVEHCAAEEQARQDEEREYAQAAQKPSMVPFLLESVHPCVVQAHTACKAWLSCIVRRTQPHFLTLSGPTGCGKTHLARNAKYALSTKGIPCTIASWAKVILASKTKKAEDEFYHLATVKVLVLDGIGAENTRGEFSRGLSDALLVDLMERRENRWTMFLTTLTMPQLAKLYSERAESRLHRNGSIVVDMSQAQDYNKIPNTNSK